jgi:hypothetical protein
MNCDWDNKTLEFDHQG